MAGCFSFRKTMLDALASEPGPASCFNFWRRRQDPLSFGALEGKKNVASGMAEPALAAIVFRELKHVTVVSGS